MTRLQEKIDYSIALIRKAERLALAMKPDDGLYVGFSGGKDSQVVLELVKMAGVKFRAVYNVTTNDPADNVRFIRQHYPDVKFKVPQHSFFQLIARNGLPTRLTRWCCRLFKESQGVGYTVVTGVRKEESRARADYDEVTRWSAEKYERGRVDIDTMADNEFRCVGGKDKFMVYPILEWTEKDVWEFISLRGLPVNPCYNSRSRVGCVFCPFARPRDVKAYCETHPRLKEAFINSIARYVDRLGDRSRLPDAEAYYDWWLSKLSINEYIALQRQTRLDL